MEVPATLRKKFDNLKARLKVYDKVLVAYSGGVDSTFLVKCCQAALGKGVLAVTAVSPTYTKRELNSACETVRSLGVKHTIIRTEELSDPDFQANPSNRCYFCKYELFTKLRSLAQARGIKVIADGSNYDDLKDYRPGSLAKKELGVISPLAEAGFTKNDIRRLSKMLGLKTWDFASSACLASRFSYGQNITEKGLQMVEKAENFLRLCGFKVVRVRHYSLSDNTKLARIEVEKRLNALVLAHFRKITRYFKKLGYNYVTLDLEGYRAGSMNEGLPRLKSRRII